MKYLVFWLAFTITTIKSMSQVMPPDNIRKFSLFLKIGQATGTGFISTDSSYSFLCTARHVIFGSNPANNTPLDKTLLVTCYPKNVETDDPLILEIDLNSAIRNKGLFWDKRNDAVIIRITNATPYTPGFRTIKLPDWVSILARPNNSSIPADGIRPDTAFENVKAGSGALVIGYPTSIISGEPIDMTRPLYRTGVIAGKDYKTRRIIISAPIYPGNSGGLVYAIEYTLLSATWYRIGFVSQFLAKPDKVTLYQIDSGTKKPVEIGGFNTLDNAGYGLVVPIEFINRLIKEQKNF